ncbi:MAG: type IV secretory system conjugative DNA transfer family protein [Micavibrio sp.]
MALDTRKYEKKHTELLRDTRPLYVRFGEWLKKPDSSFAVCLMGSAAIYMSNVALMTSDVILVGYLLFLWWLMTRKRALAFKLPMGAKYKDPNNSGPGNSGKAEGILYLGNVDKTNEEVWFTNSDARTHILYLGTTGAGKTEGLKSMVTNALTWASGFVYIDGKADTDLWSSLSSLVRRFGRDDDLLVLNYMTGNSDTKAPSNTMNPFSSGSASYLTNMLVSLMPNAEGDNAMWKERAVALVASLMPVMTWKRDNQELPMSVSTIRTALNLDAVIRLSRDPAVPDHLKAGVKGYLDTLPGYIDNAFDDDGKEKPAGPDQPMVDTTTPRQQHGYLAMQFTRSLQSLGDDYGYIFDTQAADVDMLDVVLNRRILVVLIPALEKSSDETANLGKIVAATIKGMMGSTLGSTVEGESATVIENKVTTSATPFMTVFDEVGYYTAQGMAVMAAQARSLGFCLIYSAQDLPAMEKRVKEEARSITANCNIKIFGKLEDPTQTKEFFEKTVGSTLVMEASGFQLSGGSASTGSYYDTKQAGLQIRARASYDALRGFKAGQACIAFGEMVIDTQIFYCAPGFAKAMRVQRFVALPPPDEQLLRHAPMITKVRDALVNKTWTAAKSEPAAPIPDEIAAIVEAVKYAETAKREPAQRGMAAIAGVHILHNPADLETSVAVTSSGSSGGIAATPAPAAPPAPIPTAPPAAQINTQASPQASAPVSPIAAIIGKSAPSSPVAPATPAAPPTPPPATAAPIAPTAPVTPPPAATETPAAASGGNPMSFFAKKPAGEETSAAPAATPAATPSQEPVAEEAPRQGKPLNWEDLVNSPDTEPESAEAAASPAAPAAPTEKLPDVDDETRAILEQAAKDMEKKIRGEGNDDGNAS